MTSAHRDRGGTGNETVTAVTVRAGPSEKIMVAIEMPLEFISHPVMKQVGECLVTSVLDAFSMRFLTVLLRIVSVFMRIQCVFNAYFKRFLAY